MTDRKLYHNIKKFVKCQLVTNIILAFLINFVIELCGRKTIKATFLYLIDQPLVFFFNMGLILLSLCFVFLIKRRIFGVVVISTLWLGIGIINGVMLGYRITPFTVVDFTLISSAFTIMGKYLSVTQQILLYIVVFLILGIFLFVYIKAPKMSGTLKLKRNLMGVIFGLVAFYFLTKGALATGVVSRYFGNIAFAYQEYGVPYCFTVTFVDRGVKMPVGYSEKAVKAAPNKKLKDAKAPFKIKKGTKKKTPNIIFLQLESFIDPTLVKGLTFSEDPIPTFRALKEGFSSGYLNVPVVGAGTCNTEFEVITGMNMDYFGPGEYPYKSIMKKTTSESIAYNLKELGYATHAIHNNNGNFYGRNKVFSRLGFDTFTSIEYMKYVSMNPIGWAKDKVLTDEIMNILTKTEEKDMLYTVSVQGHGNYPSAPTEEDYNITVDGIKEEGYRNAFEYYLSQIKEMDEFIANLILQLSNYEEETILVLYGDHLPSLGIEKKDLKSKSIYKTEYIIWSNFEIPKKDRNLQSYQLGAAVLSKMGIDNGTLIKYHQNNMGAKRYQKYLRLLQYDMLYGKRYLYEQTNPFLRTEIKMGIDDIIVTSVLQDQELVFVQGENFTEYSAIYVNGDIVESKYLDENTIQIADYKMENEDVITVCQIGNNQTVLSTSNEYVYYLAE